MTTSKINDYLFNKTKNHQVLLHNHFPLPLYAIRSKEIGVETGQTVRQGPTA